MILWIVVIFAITLNGIDTFHSPFLELQNNIPYGQYLAKKWFLVTAAFSVLIYWLARKKNLAKEIKYYLVPSVLIALSLLIARFQSFQGWFWHDDYREMGYFYKNTGDVDTYYPFAIFFLVIRWFHLNYALYDGLTLIFYFLSGILIYLIANLLQQRKYISLLSAVFFVTSPAYFQEWFLIINFTGNAFVLLLFLISFYLSLKKFWPGALIFTAAALEFGLVRTNLTPFYIILAGLLFTAKNLLLQKKLLLVLVAFLVLLLPYITISLSHLSFSSGVAVPTNFNHFLTIGDMLAEIAVPFAILTPLMKFLGPILNNWPYLPVFIGYLILLIPITLMFVFRKNVLVLKIIFLALFIFISGVIIPSLIGRRVHHNAEKFLEYLQTAPYPTVQTAYSIFSVVGLTLFYIGLGVVTKPQIFKTIMIFLIILNISTYIKSDQVWIKNYAFPQRKENDQLELLLPKTQSLYVYVVPSLDPALKHYQRHLWQGIRNFQMTHRPNQLINTYLYQKDLDEAVNKDKLSSTQIYFMQEDANYNISKIDSISKDFELP